MGAADALRHSAEGGGVVAAVAGEFLPEVAHLVRTQCEIGFRRLALQRPARLPPVRHALPFGQSVIAPGSYAFHALT